MLNFLTTRFSKKKKTPLPKQEPLEPAKVVVIAFEDDCSENSGKILTSFLKSLPFLSVEYYDPQIEKSFLNLQEAKQNI